MKDTHHKTERADIESHGIVFAVDYSVTEGGLSIKSISIEGDDLRELLVSSVCYEVELKLIELLD